MIRPLTRVSFATLSMWLGVITVSSPHHLRSGISITSIMPKPQNTAPMTK